MNTTAVSDIRIDVRPIVPRDRHTLIFNRFDEIEPGQALQIINDHDPQGLRRQFAEYLNGKFAWDYLEAGPELWRVRITKLGPVTREEPVAQSSCCSGGSCCG